jgi:outer membrane immunogenic protein
LGWQPGCALFGVEVDYDWTRATAEKFHTDNSGVFDTLNVSNRLNGFGTVRARTGVVVDNVLIYVTGGFAWANFDRSWTLCDNRCATTETIGYNKTRLAG